MTKKDFETIVRKAMVYFANSHQDLGKRLDNLYYQIKDYWYLYGILFEKGHCVATNELWRPNDDSLLEFAKFIGKPLYRVYDAKDDVFWIGTNIPALTDTWLGLRMGLDEFLRHYADEDTKIYYPSGAIEIKKAA